MKINTRQMEVVVANHFNPRLNMIVPNISWGLGLHECDLLVVRKSRYAIEVEIKISKADLVKDKDKRHGHESDKLKELWFALPEPLEKHIEHVPERAGIVIVREHTFSSWSTNYEERTVLRCDVIRKAVPNKDARKLTEEEYHKVGHLGCMRIIDYIAANNRLRIDLKAARAEIKELKKQLGGAE